jgi:hypothetical protein
VLYNFSDVTLIFKPYMFTDTKVNALTRNNAHFSNGKLKWGISINKFVLFFLLMNLLLTNIFMFEHCLMLLLHMLH